MQSKEFKDYICVIVSTLNQMVNYIPLKHFEFKEIYNLTIDDSKYASNNIWDKNLKEFFPNIQDISFKQSQIGNIKAIKRNLNKFKNKKVFWNITGGQRSFILAINQLVEKDDIICYLEGNRNRLILLKNNQEKKNIIKDYSREDLTIEIALKLMGFDNININYNENHIDTNIVESFFDIYKNTSNELRDLLINTKNLDEQTALNKLDKLNFEDKESVKKVLKWGYNKNKSIPFGYILEEMSYFFINKKNKELGLKSLLNELKSSVKLLDEKNKFIDEFDLVLLTKNGKLIVFECKSGDMKGDVAKSTKYSTYAISGAYGLPILITPLLKDEIENLDNLEDSVYKYIKKAIKSAKRAGLEVWGLNEIEDNLKKYIEL